MHWSFHKATAVENKNEVFTFSKNSCNKVVTNRFIICWMTTGIYPDKWVHMSVNHNTTVMFFFSFSVTSCKSLLDCHLSVPSRPTTIRGVTLLTKTSCTGQSRTCSQADFSLILTILCDHILIFSKPKLACQPGSVHSAAFFPLFFCLF